MGPGDARPHAGSLAPGGLGRGLGDLEVPELQGRGRRARVARAELGVDADLAGEADRRGLQVTAGLVGLVHGHREGGRGSRSPQRDRVALGLLFLLLVVSLAVALATVVCESERGGDQDAREQREEYSESSHAPAIGRGRLGSDPSKGSDPGCALYLTSTVAPASSSCALIESASSWATPSLTACGAESTRSFASLRPRPVTARTTLITWIFCWPAPVRTTSKAVFSSTAAAPSPPAPGAAAIATGAAAVIPHSSSILFFSSTSSSTVMLPSCSKTVSTAAISMPPGCRSCRRP